MTIYAPGDIVLITIRNCRHHNRTGTISEVREGNTHPYRIDGLEPWWFSETELAKEEK